MTEKKVLYIHTGEWPSQSPSIVFVTGTVFGLADAMPTTLFIRNNSGETTDVIFRSLTGHDIPDRLEIVREGFGGKTPGHAKFFRKAMQYAGKLAKNDELAAVITRSVGFLPYLAYIRKRHSVPCFFETHDFFTDLTFRTDLKKSLRVRKNRLFEKTFFPKIDGLICLTETQKKLFGSHYPKLPITVAHSGLLKVERNTTNRAKQLCYVGSLDEHKGLGTVLSALAQTADSDISLLVIGGKNEHEMHQFMDLARLMNVGGRVTITGWVHHSDVGHMMDHCIAGIVPISDTPFNRFITSPLKILDCLSRSLPVIASDLPSVREYIEEDKHGILFTPDDAESLAEAMDRCVAGDFFHKHSQEISLHAENFLYTIRGEKIAAFVSASRPADVSETQH